MEKKKLKPVVYSTYSYKTGAPNTTQQLMLLKAMRVTQDPQELKKMIGAKTVAEVYRTLDKMAMRKEYHKALEKHGISFDYIAKRLAEESDNTPGSKSSDRIKALQILLKSLGMESYDGEGDANGGTWEELLVKAVEEERKKTSMVEAKKVEGEIPEYEVVIPERPDSAREKREEENNLLKGIYENK